ncbi:MAG: hypothetical protein ACKVJA_01260 [Flavobacteriales bacterium]
MIGLGQFSVGNDQTLFLDNTVQIITSVSGVASGCVATSNPIIIFSGHFYFFINTIGNDSLCLTNGQVILDTGNYSTFN